MEMPYIPDTPKKCAAVILAAGLGTRMKSEKAKVLHEIMEKPMVLYVVETAMNTVGKNIILVVGYQAKRVMEVVSAKERVSYALQEKQLGTGHAAMVALPFIAEEVENVLILCGDVPLLTKETVGKLLLDHLKANRDLTIMAANVENPTGYGRVIFDENRNLLKIVEEADATLEQKKIRTINTGIYCVRKDFLSDSLAKINTHNAQGELYLTDIIEVGYVQHKSIGVIVCDNAEEAIGVNSRDDLLRAEKVLQKRSVQLT